MSAFQSTVKALFEHTAILSGTAAIARRRHSNDTLILAYHNIVPHGAAASGDRSLHLPQRDFGRQLDLLLHTHEIVELSTALGCTQRFRSAARDRPLAAVTFDDAYTGAMTAGIAELSARNIPATMFVAPQFVGGGTFWWDVLAQPDAGLADPVRTAALEELRGRHADIVTWAHTTGLSAHDVPEHARCSTIVGIEAALQYDKLTMGSHTWGHPNLARLNPEELAQELTSSRDWLSRFGDRALPVVSYPYGLANDVVWAAASAAGYTHGLMVDGGWTRAGHENLLAIPRLNIPAGVSDDGFAMRSSGLLAT